MRVVFRPGARDDLRAIAYWIARDDLVRAQSFVDELEQRALGLGTMPRRGALVGVVGGSPVHKANHGRYLIYYRIRPNLVEILAVRHGAQRQPTFD